ncbi:MAG: adenine deaminase [Bacteroidales bacterium]|nr:adenine deaminase [Bacteroidales bacterium]
MNTDFTIKANLVDVVQRRVFPAEILITDGRVVRIQEIKDDLDLYIMPGFVDAHVHIESSMLVPSEFARLAVAHGTVATVSDPHEIANVLGIEGLEFMLDNASEVPLRFYFGVPSCVPATAFETSGSVLDASDVEQLLARDEFKYLSEMMNFPGVIYEDKEVWAKINAAKKYNKPIDGHAPSLSGEGLLKYASAGITTDHESVSVEEAVEKIRLGIKLQIREGSAAKNFEALYSVIDLYPDDVMLCSDDRHPDDLLEGHVNDFVVRALNKGLDLFNVLRAVTYNPVKHYGLDVGLLQKGDYADFIVIKDLKKFNVLSVYIHGKKVYSNNEILFSVPKIKPINNFNIDFVSIDDIRLKSESSKAKVMLAKDGDLYTKLEVLSVKNREGFIVSDVDSDILKIVVVNRYAQAKPQVALVKGFGLKAGAIAGSVAHDSHNIIAVGVRDEDILRAINLVIKEKGGMVAVNEKTEYVLALPVAGLMSDKPGEEVAELYQTINKVAKGWGSTLHAPFMTLSFMALLVIPELKIGDKGLFDGKEFKFTNLFV